MRVALQALRDLVRDLRATAAVRSRFHDVQIEHRVTIKGDLANLQLGRSVVIQSGTVIHLGGHPWALGKGSVVIGDNSVISPNCVLYGAGPAGLRIGRSFDCGPGVCIFASRTDYTLGPEHHVFAPVEIGDEVIVYANAVIGPGVKIGDRAVVAAGSVVTRDVPGGCLVGGAPSRIIRRDVR